MLSKFAQIKENHTLRSETGSMNTNTIKINCVAAKSSLLIDHTQGEVYIELA